MSHIYKKGEIVRCPHCGEEDSDPVEDYVVQGPHHIIGKAYESECGWCDELFSVTKLSEDEYKVQ